MAIPIVKYELYKKSCCIKSVKILPLIKAMNLVFENRHLLNYDSHSSESLLKDWVMMNTKFSLKKYFKVSKDHFKKPLKYSS